MITKITKDDLVGLDLTSTKKMLVLANRIAMDKQQEFSSQDRDWHPSMDIAHNKCIIDAPAPFIPSLVYALRLRSIAPVFLVQKDGEDILVHADMDDYYDTVVAETSPGFCIKAEHMDDISFCEYYVATASKESPDWKYMTNDSGGSDAYVFYEAFSDKDVVAVHLDYEDGWVTRGEWDAIEPKIEDGYYGELSMLLKEYREGSN